MPTGATLAMVESRTTNVATAVPVAGLAAGLCNATIGWPGASTPSAHTAHVPPAASVSHACVSGQRSWMRTTRCVSVTSLYPECRQTLISWAGPTPLPAVEPSVSMAPTPALTVTVLVAGQSGGATIPPFLNVAVPAGPPTGGNDELSDEANRNAVSGNAGAMTAPYCPSSLQLKRESGPTTVSRT